MRSLKYILYALLLMLVFVACDNSDDVDTEKPTIDNDFSDASPIGCDTLYFGETLDVSILLADNVELGSYSIDIHNNFDGHSHSTEIEACEADEEKDAVNPYSFINDYDIPDGLTDYETELSISISSYNDDGTYDEGDYHFILSVTDSEGWSTYIGLSVKMLYP